MGQYQVTVSEVIDAPVEIVHAILSDYHQGHPSVLPKQYFKELTVMEGGNGAGTVARVSMDVMGSKRTFVVSVTEPVPGRVIVEEDAATGILTRFTLDPQDDRRTKVTITSDFHTTGLRGFFERMMNPSITRRIYRDELALLNDVARKRTGQGASGFG